MNDVEFRYHDDVIVAKFRSLLTQKSRGNDVLFYKPTIDFEGNEYIVGFSTEALKRTCERTMKDPLIYDALWEMCMHTLRIVSRAVHLYAFSFFDECPASSLAKGSLRGS